MDPEFQSTAPVWGPTNQKGKQVFGRIISIHGPRVGADHIGNATLIRRIDFNPRPPCGGRLGLRGIGNLINLFQSTAPVWGPTLLVAPDIRAGGISIHGPRVGADPKSQAVRQTLRHFNPRPPCGGRPSRIPYSVKDLTFQSTAPVWGPTSLVDMAVKDTVISIHGPRVGADRPGQHHAHRRRHFNPRPPCGGRPAAPPGDQRIRVISIHGPRVGADIPLKHGSGRCLISIHGPRVGADCAGH